MNALSLLQYIQLAIFILLKQKVLCDEEVPMYIVKRDAPEVVYSNGVYEVYGNDGLFRPAYDDAKEEFDENVIKRIDRNSLLRLFKNRLRKKNILPLEEGDNDGILMETGIQPTEDIDQVEKPINVRLELIKEKRIPNVFTEERKKRNDFIRLSRSLDSWPPRLGTGKRGAMWKLRAGKRVSLPFEEEGKEVDDRSKSGDFIRLSRSVDTLPLLTTVKRDSMWKFRAGKRAHFLPQLFSGDTWYYFRA